MKVPELTGAKLDYWVAMALGLEDVKFHPVGPYETEHARGYTYVDYVSAKGWLEFRPSRDWRDGGPLIDAKCVWLSDQTDAGYYFWEASTPTDDWSVRHTATGATPLIAAMRALVASKYGDEVPDEI